MNKNLEIMLDSPPPGIIQLAELESSLALNGQNNDVGSRLSRKELHRNIVVGVCVTGSVLMGSLLFPFVAPGLKRIALPFVPATDRQVELVRSVLSRRKGTMIDLGSGDGRLVIAAAKEGLQATGVELNSWLVLWSRYQSFRSGLLGRAKFRRQNLYKTNFQDFDNIVLFGVPGMMESIKKKLATEMKNDSIFIACRFPLPDSEPADILGSEVDTVWVYRKSDILNAKSSVSP